MKTLAKLISPERVKQLTGSTKAEVLDELIPLLVGAPEVKDADALRRAIFEREKIMSTGIGQGLAIPHARLDSVTNFVGALGLSRAGIPFDAFDDQPVHIVVMIAGPPRHREYLPILAQVTLTLKQEWNRRKLLEITTGDELAQALEGMTEGPPR